eukprot:g2937.t1
MVGRRRRPMVRASKLAAWKTTAPLTGYLRWREMQLTLNEQMLRIFRGVADLSLLKGSTEKELLQLEALIKREEKIGMRVKKEASNLKDTYLHGGSKLEFFLNNDENPDADVKFYVDNTRRVSPHSIILRQMEDENEKKSVTVKKEVSIKIEGTKSALIKSDSYSLSNLKKTKKKKTYDKKKTPSKGFNRVDSIVTTRLPHTPAEPPARLRSAVQEPKYGKAHSSKNGAQIVLIGTDCHISMAIIWKKTSRVEFFDSRGGNGSIEQIKSFFLRRYKYFDEVNHFDIQGKEEYDVYCHTWIYYYAYCRLIHKQTSETVLKALESLSDPERLTLIKSFHDWVYDLADIISETTDNSDSVVEATLPLVQDETSDVIESSDVKPLPDLVKFSFKPAIRKAQTTIPSFMRPVSKKKTGSLNKKKSKGEKKKKKRDYVVQIERKTKKWT